jgi:hypothetical protein
MSVDLFRTPGRDTVALAVRRVAHAEGRTETVQRLRELADEANRWTDALDANQRRGQGALDDIIDLLRAA